MKIGRFETSIYLFDFGSVEEDYVKENLFFTELLVSFQQNDP